MPLLLEKSFFLHDQQHKKDRKADSSEKLRLHRSLQRCYVFRIAAPTGLYPPHPCPLWLVTLYLSTLSHPTSSEPGLVGHFYVQADDFANTTTFLQWTCQPLSRSVLLPLSHMHVSGMEILSLWCACWQDSIPCEHIKPLCGRCSGGQLAEPAPCSLFTLWEWQRSSTGPRGARPTHGGSLGTALTHVIGVFY